MIQKDQVRNLFKNLETGHGDEFFARVRDDVVWQVMGTHPLAGTYSSKSDFFHATFERLNRIMNEGVVLKVVDVYLDGQVAIVEMQSLSTAHNGKPFDNRYCWVCTFDESGMIGKVRAYLDSALVAAVIAENETVPN
ncbi:MAG: nuclear transport factor 2 family protein [Roseibium sp.]|uniref:nuclear transport factor 2 family protein n=1 Tax=Roseibium sp. TaxID=1936156 RepID=UPI00262F5382|nr:nuclear transport factor 2 family protein [Roseibium sp.]MCV0428798.1 nuclear transport factor 2 family protein [Roseibium sp.]